MSNKENKLFDLKNMRTYFEVRNVLKTVKWLEKLIEDISEDNPFDADMYYTDIYQSFKEDLKKNMMNIPEKHSILLKEFF